MATDPTTRDSVLPSEASRKNLERGGSLPDFVVIGAMRSGTTSLLRYLGSHPQVLAPDVKEVHFFDRHFERGVDWYRTHFIRSTSHLACGEATPDYMFEPQAAPRMSRVIPDASLIAILRNPVDRAYSHYWQKRSYGKEPLSFEDALEAEPERLEESDAARALYSYVARGRYFGQLKRFAEYFPRSSMTLVLFESMKSDPESVYKQVCRAVGIEDTHLPDSVGDTINPYLTFRSTRIRTAARSLPGVLKRVVGRINARPDRYPPMRPETRQRLLDLFREENGALAEWSGLDLSVWEK